MNLTHSTFSFTEVSTGGDLSCPKA